jgi:hypothetical protein
LGIGLLAVDGLESREGVETMLQRLVWVGGAAALIGIVEFASDGFIYREAMRLPGLTINTEVINDTRSGFDRVHGAAAHPIEYAVALAALAPLALNFALHAKTPPPERAQQGSSNFPSGRCPRLPPCAEWCRAAANERFLRCEHQ